MSSIDNPLPSSVTAEAPAPSSPAPKADVPAPEASQAPAPAAVAEIAAKASAGETLTKKEEKQLKEYKLKVNGKEKSLKIDISNDAEMQKYLQKALASDESFSQAAEVRKAAMSFIDDLKKNPKKVLSDPNIGVDLKKFAEEIMNEAIQEMEKSPEQKRADDAERKLKEIMDQREREQKDFNAKEVARIQAEHERNLETEISAALDVGGLPKTPRTVKHMAEMMMIAMSHGIELSAKEIAPIVKSTTLSEFKEVVGSLTDDQLEDFIGKEVVGRLRKKNVAKAKAVDTASSVKSTGVSVKKEEEKAPAKKQTIREFLGA
jgi:small-conductance mechanosensitive channel